MIRKSVIAMLVLAVSLVLAACAPTSGLDPNFTPPEEIQTALDAAISYVQQQYPDQAPAADLTWAGANITPEGLVGSVTYAFESGDFHVEINHCVCAPEDIEYHVDMTNEQTGFAWSGVVTPSGEVREVIVE
jgi:hypothetical protein